MASSGIEPSFFSFSHRFLTAYETKRLQNATEKLGLKEEKEAPLVGGGQSSQSEKFKHQVSTMSIWGT
jgi:hypothetical protein